MGTLLDFASARRPLARQVNRPAHASPNGQKAIGKVILFPGARYDQHELDLGLRIATIGQVAGPCGPDKD